MEKPEMQRGGESGMCPWNVNGSDLPIKLLLQRKNLLIYSSRKIPKYIIAFYMQLVLQWPCNYSKECTQGSGTVLSSNLYC